MYENQTEGEVACYDPNNMPEVVSGTVNDDQENGFSHDYQSNNNNTPPFTPIDHNLNNNDTQEIDSTSMGIDFPNPDSNWTTKNVSYNNMNMSHEMGYSNFDENVHTTTSDLLTLLHLPRCSFASSSSLSFGKSSLPPPHPSPHSGLAFLGEMNSGMSMMHDHGPGSGYDMISAATLPYDPHFHLNLPPQSSTLLRDLMNGNGIGNYGNCSSLFGGLDGGEGKHNDSMNGIPGIYQQEGGEQQHENGVFEFSRGKRPKQVVTEKQRRQNFNDKYLTLGRLIVPTPTKTDRASIVLDAINYIEELKRTVGELKLLVEKKRVAKDRPKRLKSTEDTAANGGGEHAIHDADSAGLVKPDPDEEFAGSTATQLRSSWLQRKCKDTEIDVRIVDDEVTIKLVQRKKINCLLSVSRTLDDLQLDLRHVAGGQVGDYYSYLFNSKICEGSSVFASAIANKLIDVVERQYAAVSAVAPTTSF